MVIEAEKIQWKTDKNEITRLLFGIEIESKLGFQKQQTKYFSKFVQISVYLLFNLECTYFLSKAELLNNATEKTTDKIANQRMVKNLKG